MNRYRLTKTRGGYSIQCDKCRNLISISKNKYSMNSSEPGAIILICPKCYKCNVMCVNKSHTQSSGYTTEYVGCEVNTTYTVSRGRYNIYNIILKYAAGKCVKDDIRDYLINLFNDYFPRPVLELIMEFYYSNDTYLWFVKKFSSQVIWDCHMCENRYRLLPDTYDFK
jgi:hypothetical protein